MRTHTRTQSMRTLFINKPEESTLKFIRDLIPAHMENRIDILNKQTYRLFYIRHQFAIYIYFPSVFNHFTNVQIEKKATPNK